MRHALAAEVQLQGQAATAAARGGALTVGTYELDERSGTRQGGLVLFQVQQGRDGSVRAAETHAASCAGVFEAAWDPGCSAGRLGTALADGSLALWALEQSETDSPALQLSASCQVFEDAALSTDLAFQLEGAGGSRRVAVASSAGQVAVLAEVWMRFHRRCTAPAAHGQDSGGWSQETLRQEQRWQAHQAEIWACSYTTSQASPRTAVACRCSRQVP